MRIGVITLFPEMFDAISDYGVSSRALKRGIWELACWNPRDYTRDRHRTVDDRPYGGGPGMLMKVAPLRDAIQAARQALGDAARVIYLSPQGKRLQQDDVKQLAEQPSVILLCGRYEGIDERLIAAEVDEEWSIGDYVLSGGEVAAMAVIDATVRLLPGTLGDADSAQQDSFMAGLLDCPHYTRPEELGDDEVPPVLLSGDHEAIRRWRLKQALGRTWLRRPDLLEGRQLEAEQAQLLAEFIAGQDDDSETE